MPKDLAKRCLTTIMVVAGYSMGAVIIVLNLLVLAGVAIIILEYAFGIEMPKGFDWLLPDWFQKLFTR